MSGTTGQNQCMYEHNSQQNKEDMCKLSYTYSS